MAMILVRPKKLSIAAQLVREQILKENGGFLPKKQVVIAEQDKHDKVIIQHYFPETRAEKSDEEYGIAENDVEPFIPGRKLETTEGKELIAKVSKALLTHNRIKAINDFVDRTKECFSAKYDEYLKLAKQRLLHYVLISVMGDPENFDERDVVKFVEHLNAAQKLDLLKQLLPKESLANKDKDNANASGKIFSPIIINAQNVQTNQPLNQQPLNQQPLTLEQAE